LISLLSIEQRSNKRTVYYRLPGRQSASKIFKQIVIILYGFTLKKLNTSSIPETEGISFGIMRRLLGL
jgi:hypothetical protein